MKKPSPDSQDWFADDEFWRATFPFMFPDSRFAETPGQVDQILALTGLETPADSGAVLDLCCGPGRVALALAERGFTVTGVDLSEFLLGIAREREMPTRDGGQIEWVREDMREFVRPGGFGLVLNLFTSFGYFAEPTDDLRVLRNMHESLHPGGVVVIDVMSKEILARRFTATSSQRLEDGRLLIERREILDGWSRIACEWILLPPDGDPQRFRFSHTLYSGQELRARMAQAGFVDIRLYGNFGGAPYGLEASRLIVVGKR